MKLAFTTLACPDWTLEQALEAAKRWGYEGIELRLLDAGLIGPGLRPEDRQRVREALHGAGLPLVCLDTSIGLAQTDPAEQDEQVRNAAAMLELAAEWHAPFIRVFGGPPQDTPIDQAVQGAVSTLEMILPRAEELGVAVALETHDAFSSSRTVQEVLAATASPSAGALWDTHHPFRVGETPEITVRRLADTLLHVHIKDARKKPDGNWDLCLLGKGEVPNAEIIRRLDGIGYDGWLSVEWEKKWHPEIEGPEVALPQHADLLRIWLAGI